ncbi:MAG: DUF4831 family protein [Bacteroidales bacterium]|nr:DUF4831 family protein [Bacteroidales bacterium]
MKQTHLIICCVVALLTTGCQAYKVYPINAQTRVETSGGIAYALPLTSVHIRLAVAHTDLSHASYADFAHEMLGIDMPPSDSLYTITGVEISTLASADPLHYYYVVPRRIALSVGPQGLLRQIGTPYTPTALDQAPTSRPPAPQRPPQAVGNTLYDRADTFYTRYDQPGHPSRILTKKDVRSPRQQATRLAEQIETIQEKKMQLLFGEYEGNYSAEVIPYLYEMLDARERELRLHFTGYVVTDTVDFYFTPGDARNYAEPYRFPLCLFSPSVGVCDTLRPADDADTVWCSIVNDNTLKRVTPFIKHRATRRGFAFLRRQTFKYRLSESATVRVDVGQHASTKQVRVSQFGPISTLPPGKLNAAFDDSTGELLYYEAQ